MKFLVFVAVCLLGIPILLFLMMIFASYIHPNHLSSVARINKQIEINDSCRMVYATLDKYKNKNPMKIAIGEAAPSESSKWEDKPNINTIISLSDDTTPFDMITLYVLCGKSDNVLGTYLVGD